jgi:hypothetical protein
MMAKKTLGRPPGDPNKRKLVRFSLRLHPDLYDAIAVLAEKYGLPMSTAAVHILVNAVNAEEGYNLLSLHGYRADTAPPPSPKSGISYLRMRPAGLKSPGSGPKKG